MLLPVQLLAQSKKVIKKVEMQLTAAKTAFGDLVSSGDISIIEMYNVWV
ncbi:MAG: hypothetical protein ACI4TU_04265 [Candidatus Cryptobacteroides sp.]